MSNIKSLQRKTGSLMDLVILGAYVHCTGPDTCELAPNGVIGIKNGVIALLESRQSQMALEAADTANRVIRLSPGQFVVPGFVDTHIHAPQYPNAGILGKTTLLDWLERYTFPLEAKFADVGIARNVYSRVVQRSLSCGTTTASYFGTVHAPATEELARVCLERGQRALVGRVCMERFAPEELVSVENEHVDRDFVDAIEALDPNGKHVRPCITPRFAPSCTEDALKRLGALAKDRNLPVQTHISENAREIDWVAELFPDARNYADVYDRAGLLGNQTILAHAIHLKPEEIDTVVRCGCGISHCPISNSSIASGIAPIKKYLSRTLKIGLGTDISGGSSLNVLENARHALLYSRLLSQARGGDSEVVLSVENALYLATLGGARVAGIDEFSGSFKVGKKWDAQLIDVAAPGSPIDIFDFALPTDPLERLDNLVQKWMYVGDDRNTLNVWVDGVAVVEKSPDSLH